MDDVGWVGFKHKVSLVYGHVLFGINFMLGFVPMEPLPPASSVLVCGRLQQYTSVLVF